MAKGGGTIFSKRGTSPRPQKVRSRRKLPLHCVSSNYNSGVGSTAPSRASAHDANRNVSQYDFSDLLYSCPRHVRKEEGMFPCPMFAPPLTILVSTKPHLAARIQRGHRDDTAKLTMDNRQAVANRSRENATRHFLFYSCSVP